jgi:hypothetical protein
MKEEIGKIILELGVSDGDRTRDNRNHNPVLYQLSYAHHKHGVKRIHSMWYAWQDSNLLPSA